MAAEGTCA